ncbi:MAG: oligosaccharide flippase family protein, partial [Candidatus Latescibacteria bacterium]|nr:oligosaccharide flippase family protein [Candidatus Latescibacterota bacterium]
MRRLTQQVFFLTLEKASHLGGAMLLLIAVARLLGEAALGTYAYIIAITAIFVPILDVGLNTRVIRSVAAGNGTAALQDAFAFKLRFGPIALFLMIACAWWADKPADVVLAVFLVGVSTWAMSVGDAFNAVFKGVQRAGYSALLVGGTYICLTGLGIGAMIYGAGILGIAVAYTLCRLGFMVAAWVLIRR